MTILKDYRQFDGLAWATGYVRNVLAYQGAVAPHTGQPYTEAMLMGINGGLCAGYFVFEYEGHDPHLHFLTRYLFNEEPGAVFERLCIPMNQQQTTNPQKGVANLLNALAQDKPAIVWADMASLDYNNFPGSDDIWMVMPLVVYGYDITAGTVHIADRARVPLTVSSDVLEKARQRIKKTKYRIMTIGAPDPDKLPAAIQAGIRACISIFTETPSVGSKGNFGFDAFKKWAALLADTKSSKGWAKQFAPGPRMYNGLKSAYQYLEVFFTGGSGARGIYADFLDEAAVVLNKPELKAAAEQFRVCAGLWRTLTNALLPDHIAPLKETRDLLLRSYNLFMEQGGASLPERRQISARLNALRGEMAQDFPLTEAQAAQMRAELREHVLRLHDAEYEAIHMLIAAGL